MSATNINKRDQKSIQKTAASQVKSKPAPLLEEERKSEQQNSELQSAMPHTSEPATPQDDKQEILPEGMMHPQPKRPLTAFIFFCMENYSKMREAKDDGQEQKSDVANVSKKLSKAWKALAEKQIKKYQEKADADKVRYQNQIEQVQANGYFSMEDGQKSNQVLVPIPAAKRMKKVSCRDFGTQTLKEWMSQTVNDKIQPRLEKLEQTIERRANALLKKRLREIRERQALKKEQAAASKVNQSIDAAKKRASLQKSNSQTPIKSEQNADGKASMNKRQRVKSASVSASKSLGKKKTNAQSPAANQDKANSKKKLSKTPTKEQNSQPKDVKAEEQPVQAQPQLKKKKATQATQSQAAKQQLETGSNQSKKRSKALAAAQ